MAVKKNEILIGGAIIFKKTNSGYKYFLVRQNDDGGWEIPKITVRKAESSVRSVIRMTSEQGNMRSRVLEEVGRLSATVKSNGKPINQRTIYYLMLAKSDSGESIGFNDVLWLDHAKALVKLDIKKEKEMLKYAQKTIKEWENRKKFRFSSPAS